MHKRMVPDEDEGDGAALRMGSIQFAMVFARDNMFALTAQWGTEKRPFLIRSILRCFGSHQAQCRLLCRMLLLSFIKIIRPFVHLTAKLHNAIKTTEDCWRVDRIKVS